MNNFSMQDGEYVVLKAAENGFDTTRTKVKKKKALSDRFPILDKAFDVIFAVIFVTCCLLFATTDDKQLLMVSIGVTIILLCISVSFSVKVSSKVIYNNAKQSEQVNGLLDKLQLDHAVEVVQDSDTTNVPSGISITQYSDQVRKFTDQVDHIKALIGCGVFNGKYSEVKTIVENYMILPTIFDAIDQANGVGEADSSDTKELNERYHAKLDALEYELYEFDEPFIKELIYRMLKEKNYDYLPPSLHKQIVNGYNKRLLKTLDDDDEINDNSY